MRVLLAMALLAWGGPVAAEPLFEDMSDRMPAHSYDGGWEHFVGGGVAVFDCNGDARPDIFAAGGANPATLIVNRRNWHFQAADIPAMTGVTGAYPIDMDADGHVDLFVLRAGPNIALRGGPDCSFSDATDLWGLPRENKWSTAFTAWWDPGDARPTLAIGNYVDRDAPDGPFEACDTNTLLIPAEDGYVAQILSPGFCPLSILTAEDARNRKTLRLSNDRHYYVKGGFEQMWDIRERRFLGEDDGWAQVSLWGMGIASRDLNADGRDEVMLTSMGDQLLQLAQSDGTYAAAPFSIGTYAQRPHTGGDGRPSTGWHSEFGDVNNDGRPDLFIAKGNVDQMPGMATRDPNNLLIQKPDGTFAETAEFAGVASLARSRGGALVDFDGDGRLDLLVSNRRAPLEMYRNVTPDTGNWLAVTLQQPGGNRDAIGARITVETPTRTLSQQNVIGGGHAGGTLAPRHFGIGADTSARVRVRWPDGSTSEIHAEAGSTVVVARP